MTTRPTSLARAALLAALLLATPASAESPYLVSPDGKYLGNLNANPYDPNSVTNPYATGADTPRVIAPGPGFGR